VTRRSRDLLRAATAQIALVVAALIAFAIVAPATADAQLWKPRKHQKPKPGAARPAKPAPTKPHPTTSRKPKAKPKAKPRHVVDDDPVIIEEDGADDRDDPRRPR